MNESDRGYRCGSGDGKVCDENDNSLTRHACVEDPNRQPAVAAGFRGGRYLSAQASAHGEWQSNGSAKPGMDAYATSKQCALVIAMSFARETSRLHFNAVEPGFHSRHGAGHGQRQCVRARAGGRSGACDRAVADALYENSQHAPALARETQFQDRVVAQRATYWRAFAGKALLPS